MSVSLFAIRMKYLAPWLKCAQTTQQSDVDCRHKKWKHSSLVLNIAVSSSSHWNHTQKNKAPNHAALYYFLPLDFGALPCSVLHHFCKLLISPKHHNCYMRKKVMRSLSEPTFCFGWGSLKKNHLSNTQLLFFSFFFIICILI